MKNNKNTFWLVFFILVIILYVVYDKISYQNEIKDNKKITTGIVVDFHFSKNAYTLTYKYKVDNIDYENEFTTSFFRCKDGTKGCVGKTFIVYYSSKNPEKSDIDLGEYNKLKNW